ncbi:MAG TPA: hypothetical protein VFE47_00885 [Tepidisphaeraceae bacterium]|nr:hypothetical protein [Tepidisphaeraceae bacterium]
MKHFQINHLAFGLLILAAAVASSRAADSSPTFNGDIAPVIYNNCSVCHHPGESAPFSLLSYRDVRRQAKQIVDITSRKIMPPWKADPDVHFIGERRLTAAQIELIRRWVDQGCAEGNEINAPKPPAFVTGWQIGEPDMVVSMTEPYTLAADGRDVYRCFVVPVKIPAGKYLKAVEFRPGNRKIVHHAVLTTLPREIADKKIAKEPPGSGPGFSSGLPAPGDRLAGPLGIWVPGKEPLPLPDGYAVAWPKGQVLIVQLHLHPDGKVEQEQSSVGLYFTDQPPRGTVQAVILFNKKVDIAPGDSAYALKASQTLKADADVVGIFPHMHLLGRTVRLTATLPDGSTEPLLSIDDWDFNWQGYYQPARPTHLPAGTRVDCTWTFDNSSNNPANPSNPPKRVTFGEQTTNEMGAVVMDVISDKPIR